MPHLEFIIFQSGRHGIRLAESMHGINWTSRLEIKGFVVLFNNNILPVSLSYVRKAKILSYTMRRCLCEHKK